jgi:hypothetical protein
LHKKSAKDKGNFTGLAESMATTLSSQDPLWIIPDVTVLIVSRVLEQERRESRPGTGE